MVNLVPYVHNSTEEDEEVIKLGLAILIMNIK